MRVVGLEEELRTSEEMVRTLQNTSQQFGGSAPSGRVEEGIGEEEKMEVMARVVSEAAIAKGKTTEHQLSYSINNCECCYGDCHCCHDYIYM